MRKRVVNSVILLAAYGAFVSAAPGGDFRVSTRVRVGDSAQPASENLTLFVGNTVYDFLDTAPRHITVFDADIGQFDLLDPSRRIRTSLSTDDLLQFVAGLKVRVVGNQRLDQVVRFAANPRFTRSYDEARKQLVLQSPVMTYRAVGDATDGDRVVRYQRFCDWFCQLNALRPGALPPFARLRLNQELAKTGLVPTEIDLTLSAREAGGGPLTLHSEHTFAAPLTDADRDRISATRAQRTEFKWVAFHEFTGVRPDAD